MNREDKEKINSNLLIISNLQQRFHVNFHGKSLTRVTHLRGWKLPDRQRSCDSRLETVRDCLVRLQEQVTRV